MSVTRVVYHPANINKSEHFYLLFILNDYKTHTFKWTSSGKIALSPSAMMALMLKEGEKGPRVHFLASVAILRTWEVISPMGRSASRARAAMEPAEAPAT